MEPIIHTLVTGSLAVNCYIVVCPETSLAAVIDPGGNFQDIRDVIGNGGLTVRYIVNTHGHADHIGANRELHAETGAIVAIGAEDSHMLPDPAANLSVFFAEPVTSPEAALLLHDGDVLEFGRIRLNVIHTPGHSMGGICLYWPGGTGPGGLPDPTVPGILFSGDTLFAESVGRTDLPGGDGEKLISGIRQRLLVLPDDTRVLPGHQEPTTIGREKQFNLFI